MVENITCIVFTACFKSDPGDKTNWACGFFSFLLPVACYGYGQGHKHPRIQLGKLCIAK